MAVRAVLDTNIWVSSFLNPSGSPAKLRKAFEEGVFHVVISEAIIEEIADVLTRPKIKDKYGISESDIRELRVGYHYGQLFGENNGWLSSDRCVKSWDFKSPILRLRGGEGAL